MEKIRSCILSSIQTLNRFKAFVDDGFDDPQHLKTMTKEEMDELCNETAKMKKGHARKMMMWWEGKYTGGD